MIALNDLAVSNDLDNLAMTAISGAGEWHLRSRSVTTGRFGAYRMTSRSYRGIRFHDGYLSRHYIEGWQRTALTVERTSWDHNVRV